MDKAMYFLLGFILGIMILVILFLLNRNKLRKDTNEVIEKVKEAFGSLSLDALAKNSQILTEKTKEILIAETSAGKKDLETTGKLINKSLEDMDSELKKVERLMQEVDKKGRENFGQVANQLKNTVEQTEKLHDVTQSLKAVLANTKKRGEWGERMAEDVLRVAGFVEGINYIKQEVLKYSETGRKRPDFTFFLPQNLKVNMDVKFPMDNYLKYMEAKSETDRENYKNLFLNDTRNRIKEVTNKEYINPEENTVDYVIVFIPNEQVYGFINENDFSILDKALENKVIICSPLTLYAILAVIRQAVDNFNLQKASAEILGLFGGFNKQWNEFKKSFDKVGNKIGEAQAEFHALTTTRVRKLEAPLRKIDLLREKKGISLEGTVEEDQLMIEGEGENILPPFGGDI